jgi:hypothetical protein
LAGVESGADAPVRGADGEHFQARAADLDRVEHRVRAYFRQRYDKVSVPD